MLKPCAKGLAGAGGVGGGFEKERQRLEVVGVMSEHRNVTALLASTRRFGSAHGLQDLLVVEPTADDRGSFGAGELSSSPSSIKCALQGQRLSEDNESDDDSVSLSGNSLLSSGSERDDRRASLELERHSFEENSEGLPEGLLSRITAKFTKANAEKNGEMLCVEQFCAASLLTVHVYDMFTGAGAFFGDMARRDRVMNVEKLKRGAERLNNTTSLETLVDGEIEIHGERAGLQGGSGTEGFIWLVRNLQFEALLIVIVALGIPDVGCVDEKEQGSQSLKNDEESVKESTLQAFRLTLGRKYSWWMRMMFENGVRLSPSRAAFLNTLFANYGQIGPLTAREAMLRAAERIIPVLNAAASFLNSRAQLKSDLPYITATDPFIEQHIC